MNRKIICTNNDGMAVEFGSKFSPFLLLSCDGIYGIENSVSTSENTMTDGATYQGSVAKMRNIVLTVCDKANHRMNRYELYNLFKPKTLGTFSYQEDTEVRVINYYVESIEIEGENNVRKATISLLCPDPFFSATSDITVTMAGWENLFQFPHQFVENGEALGERINEQLKTIENESAADNIGMTIRFEAMGNVTNPSATRVESSESIKVGTISKPMNMVAGDVIEITTGTNNKHVYFTRDGIRQEINEYLTEDSEFIQIMHGKNTIGYDADAGENNLIVSVSYRYKFLGV